MRTLSVDRSAEATMVHVFERLHERVGIRELFAGMCRADCHSRHLCSLGRPNAGRGVLNYYSAR